LFPSIQWHLTSQAKPGQQLMNLSSFPQKYLQF
jgi:hypothetical protein